MSFFVFRPDGYLFNDRWFPVYWEGEPPEQPAISAQDIEELATRYVVPPAHLDAILRVEAGRHGFILTEPRPARPKILFEAHHMYKNMPRDLRDSALHVHPDIVSMSWNRSLYKGGSKEWDRLRAAWELDWEAALESASWGLGQILGSNWKSTGAESLQQFIEDEFTSEAKQLAHVMGFIDSHGLIPALQDGHWATLAKAYNGAMYRKNNYDERLAYAAQHSDFA
jgi:hypothetical protein